MTVSRTIARGRKVATQPGNMRTLEGVILPITWNRYNQAKDFSIFTEEGDDILIDSYSAASMKKIKGNLNSRVEVQGQIYDTDMGDKIIRVCKVKKIKGLL
ncbi:MAG: hypothetical protein WCG27_07700 [Pseudomonadota bacterium]